MMTTAPLPVWTSAESASCLHRLAAWLRLNRAIEPDADVTIVTGLEGAVHPEEPVMCGYCHLGIVSDDDHAVDCCWRPGTGGAR